MAFRYTSFSSPAGGVSWASDGSVPGSQGRWLLPLGSPSGRGRITSRSSNPTGTIIPGGRTCT